MGFLWASNDVRNRENHERHWIERLRNHEIFHEFCGRPSTFLLICFDLHNPDLLFRFLLADRSADNHMLCKSGDYPHRVAFRQPHLNLFLFSLVSETMKPKQPVSIPTAGVLYTRYISLSTKSAQCQGTPNRNLDLLIETIRISGAATSASEER